MASAQRVWERQTIEQAAMRLRESVPATIEEAIAIQQIPAPTFEEEKRAAYVQQRFQAIGLSNIDTDEVGNIYGCVPGAERGLALAVTAHLDTVFPIETNLAVRREGDKVCGPAIGDNSLGVAGLLALAAEAQKLMPQRDIWFVANVGEEGLGNLNGMWAAMRRLEEQLGSVIVLEGGAYGTIVHGGIGVQRRRLTVETAGGHSWSDFGTPSAIHELCRIGAEIADMEVPTTAPTSFNLGIIEGGTSINTIAARATALLDLRAEEAGALQHLIRQVDEILESAQREGVSVRSETIGERPVGQIPATHPLVQIALASLKRLALREPTLLASSTDANVPFALGIPAVCIGLAVGHNAHRLDEYIEVSSLEDGIRHAWWVITAALEAL